MIQHICEWSKDIGFHAVNVNSKHPAAHHCPSPAKLLERVGGEERRCEGQSVVVSLEVYYFLVYLQEERGAQQFCELLRGVVDGEAGVVFGKDGDVVPPLRQIPQPALLQQKYCEAGVLRGNKLLGSCLLPDLRHSSLLEGHQLAAGNRNQTLLLLRYSLKHLYVASGDDSSITLSEIDYFEAIEPRSSLLEPFLKFLHASRLISFEVAEIAQLHLLIQLQQRGAMLMFGCATIILMMEQSQMRQGGARYENVQKLLYEKYSSTQTYFYTNKINEIIKEKHTAVNIFYEDVEYLLDLEQNLKRWYLQKEFQGKMFTFKEYYFYHQDCPRIFLKGIQDPYAKWQDRRRDLVYKQLKIAYNQSYSSADSRNEDQKSENQVAISHFLLEISDYNPYSKKYYLRVEARKEKERKKAEQMKKNHESKRDIEDLKQDLSAMLNDISQLSDISGLSVATPKHYDKYKSQKYTTISIKKSEDRSGSSTNLSNSNSLIRFNFKKNKDSAEKLALPRQLKPSRQKDRKSSSKDKERRGNEQRLSPRYSSNQMPSDLIKSKSIFSVSSFGALRQTDLKNTGLLNTGKKEQLKLNFQSKKSVQDEKKYQTEKKRDPSQGQGKNIVIKTKSTSKFEPKLSLEKFKSKDMSAGKGRNDQFSDKKMSEAQSALRMRSLKSQYVSSSKKALLSIKPTLQLQKGKRLLEIRNW